MFKPSFTFKLAIRVVINLLFLERPKQVIDKTFSSYRFGGLIHLNGGIANESNTETGDGILGHYAK